MIGRIVIENYKSIESLTLDLGRVTVLIGANGSGKSNILESIALCSAAAANKLDNEFLFSRGIRVSDDARHMRSAFSNVLSSDAIKINIFKNELLSNSEERDKDNIAFAAVLTNVGHSYSKWSDEVIKRLVDERLKRAIEFNQDTQDDSFWSKDLTEDLKEVLEKRIYREIFKFHSKVGLINFLLYCPENSTLRRFEEEGQIQPLGIRGEGLFKLLTVLAREENQDRLNELQERLQLLDWFGEFEIGGNVALGERTLRIRDQYLDDDLAYITQRSANEGFLFLLFYFTLFIAKETPRFFAVDNIDASLNPKLCAELLRQLTELAEKYDKQVILTTHNPAVLDGLNLQNDNQRLYVVERDLDGRTQARRVPAPRPPEKHEEPVPLSEAFLRGYIGGLPKNF